MAGGSYAIQPSAVTRAPSTSLVVTTTLSPSTGTVLPSATQATQITAQSPSIANVNPLAIVPSKGSAADANGAALAASFQVRVQKAAVAALGKAQTDYSSCVEYPQDQSGQLFDACVPPNALLDYVGEIAWMEVSDPNSVLHQQVRAALTSIATKFGAAAAQGVVGAFAGYSAAFLATIGKSKNDLLTGAPAAAWNADLQVLGGAPAVKNQSQNPAPTYQGGGGSGSGTTTTTGGGGATTTGGGGTTTGGGKVAASDTGNPFIMRDVMGRQVRFIVDPYGAVMVLALRNAITIGFIDLAMGNRTTKSVAVVSGGSTFSANAEIQAAIAAGQALVMVNPMTAPIVQKGTQGAAKWLVVATRDPDEASALTALDPANAVALEPSAGWAVGSSSGSKTLLYAGIGVGVVAAGVGGYFLLRKKRKVG